VLPAALAAALAACSTAVGRGHRTAHGAGAAALLVVAVFGCAQEGGGGDAEGGGDRFPPTMAWSAYPTGTQGYSNAVAIGNVLQREYGVNLRVVPGRNDVSRLATLRVGRVHFSAGGSEAVYSQEAILNFASRLWGPQPLRVAMWSIADSCSFTLATAAEEGIQAVQDVRGERVTWVQGAPSLNNATRALLAYGGLTWDDVEKVEVGGYPSSVEAVINDRADVVGGACNSPPFLRLEASPRGLRFLSFPHDNEDAVARVLGHVPWYIPHVTREGPTIPEDGVEMFTSPYPMLVTMPDRDAELVYNVVRAIHVHYDRYKDHAPGANGWALERQHFEEAFVPYHRGAIRYFREVGAWTDAAQARHERNLQRQRVLANAWERFLQDAPAGRDAFRRAWLEARARALQAHDMVTILDG